MVTPELTSAELYGVWCSEWLGGNALLGHVFIELRRVPFQRVGGLVQA